MCASKQARRDSNPQHPDLESGALAVRATGLSTICRYIHKTGYPQTIPALSKPNGREQPRLTCLAMDFVLPTKAAILPKLETIWSAALILRGGIISTSAAFACQNNHITHTNHLLCETLATSPKVSLTIYSSISLTTPAPTVRPPSRIANRNSFSIAIGVIKSTEIDTLSPGITISVPSGNVTTPVTSVVRK